MVYNIFKSSTKYAICPECDKEYRVLTKEDLEPDEDYVLDLCPECWEEDAK